MFQTTTIIPLLALLRLSAAQGASTDAPAVMPFEVSNAPTSATSFIDINPSKSSSISISSKNSASTTVTPSTQLATLPSFSAGNLTRISQVVPPPLTNVAGVVSGSTTQVVATTSLGNVLVGGNSSFTFNPPITGDGGDPSAGISIKITAFGLLGALCAFAFA